MNFSVRSITTGLGITTNYSVLNSKGLSKVALAAVDELNSRKNIDKQFLKWIDLPKKQIENVDHIYSMVEKLKGNKTGANFLSVIGIGGSKHPIEHMLSINGLNLDKKIKFISDIDSVSFNRFMHSIGNNPANSDYLVVSKSGTTFEPKDAMLRLKNMLTKQYANESDAKAAAAKHFVAVTDSDSSKSELRRIAEQEKWINKLYIHDDVGGRFSAFDDHTLFTLAYAGMKKEDMLKMLEGASAMTDKALTKDLSVNDPLSQALFWVQARMQHIKASVHQYLGSMFEDTVNWHSQMQNESIKNTLKQIAKVPDAMHHSAEAHFNPSNKYAFALTTPADKGLLSENVAGYVDALNKSYSNAGPYFNEMVDVAEYGLTPKAAGALTQSRAFSTVYQELIELMHEIKIAEKNGIEISLPKVLNSVIQPFVETYKAYLKPSSGSKVVEAGRILNKEV